MDKLSGKSVYEFLNDIRERPGLYVGSKSISRLASWLGGIQWAEYKYGIKETEDDPDFGEFHDWVADYYGWFESTAGWANIILKECNGDEAKAVDTFYELLDQFCAKESP